MSSEIVDLRNVVDQTAPVRKAVDALRDGKTIVFPTETVYGLAVLASNEKATRRLIEEKGRRAGHALPIAIAGLDVLPRYVPNPGVLATRLARRLWPGPLTLVLDGTDPKSELRKLPDASLKAIMPETTVGFRVPKNEFFLSVLREIDEPVVLTSANLTGEPPATSARAAKVGLVDRPDLIFDDGDAVYAEPSTVVRIADEKPTILRQGAISEERFRGYCLKVVLFLCTGNTCRSPMAEAIAKKIIAERLGFSATELAERGPLVISAGLAASEMTPATPEARQVVREDFGVSLDEHLAHSFDLRFARIADLILTATNVHLRYILREFPELMGRVETLRVDGGDVDDPFGGSLEVYRACARQMETQIRARLEEII